MSARRPILYGARVPFRELPPAWRWLMFSAWSCSGGPREIWTRGGNSKLPVKLAKALVSVCLLLPGVHGAVRRAAWRRIDPGFREVACGSDMAVVREAAAPGWVLKIALHSCQQDAAGQQAWLRFATESDEALRAYLGEYMEPTRFERRVIGRDPALSVCVGVQRHVAGEVFDTQRLREAAWWRDEPHLRQQWRDLCAAALAAERATGRLLDVYGPGNILIERPPGGASRLVVVDTLPVFTPGLVEPPSAPTVIAEAREILVVGLRA